MSLPVFLCGLLRLTLKNTVNDVTAKLIAVSTSSPVGVFFYLAVIFGFQMCFVLLGCACVCVCLLLSGCMSPH